jgi:hypothetical protein
MIIIKNITRFFLIICIYFSVGCSKKGSDTIDPILARIGSKTITVNEFIYRAEYTPRPVYCRGSTYIHKKIVLNSLIAEKMLALEAGDDNEFITNNNVQAYIKGRREQAMREILYTKDAYETVVLDTPQILETLNLSERVYSITYVFFKEYSSAKSFIANVPKLDTLAINQQMGFPTPENLQTRTVSWNETEHDSVLHALYTKPIVVGQVLGPLKIEKENYLVLYVNGWKEKLIITDKQFQSRWVDISGYYKRQSAQRNYDEIIQMVMRGRSIIFERNTFSKFIDILAPIYLDTGGNNGMALNSILRPEIDGELGYNSSNNDLKSLYRNVLFRLDDRIWTVENFFEKLKSHPLVFRKKTIENHEFGEQLKYAIVDLITDHYLTEKAYKSGYNNNNSVLRTEQMWKDNINALYEKNRILNDCELDSSIGSNYARLIKTYLDPVVDSLQAKYSESVKINTDIFENLKLSRIDMIVAQDNLPYPVKVPSFPLLTTDHILDYGVKKVLKEEMGISD